MTQTGRKLDANRRKLTQIERKLTQIGRKLTQTGPKLATRLLGCLVLLGGEYQRVTGLRAGAATGLTEDQDQEFY